MLAVSSGARAFLGLADNGGQYWFKVPGNPQGNQVLVNEVIVEEVGRLIGAPVRHRELSRIPASLTSWGSFPVPRSDTDLIAHASLHLPNAIDSDDLTYTRRGQNARRQASMMVLWDLCVGEDPQWLYDASDGYAIWSYDHGLWFTTGEGDWTPQVLIDLVDTVATYPNVPRGISAPALLETADRVERLTPEQLLGAMSAVPVEWLPERFDLEVMAWFLYRRAPAVAERARSLASRGPNARKESER